MNDSSMSFDEIRGAIAQGHYLDIHALIGRKALTETSLCHGFALGAYGERRVSVYIDLKGEIWKILDFHRFLGITFVFVSQGIFCETLEGRTRIGDGQG